MLVEDQGLIHRLTKLTDFALYILLPVTVGIANAFVRGVSLGTVSLPQLDNPEWRWPLTHLHGPAAIVPMALAQFHATIALAHHDL